jgi:hydrogenase maturation protease
LIVVDAAELAAEPGTVRAFVDTAMDAFLKSRGRSGHAVGLKDLLDILRLTDSLPHRRALVGIQPQVLAWGDRLSHAIASVIPQAAQRVLDLIHGWR